MSRIEIDLTLEDDEEDQRNAAQSLRLPQTQTPAQALWSEVRRSREKLQLIRSAKKRNESEQKEQEEAKCLADLRRLIVQLSINILSGASHSQEVLSLLEEVALERGLTINKVGRKQETIQQLLSFRIAPLDRGDLLQILSSAIEHKHFSVFQRILSEWKMLKDEETRRTIWRLVMAYPDLRFYQHIWTYDSQAANIEMVPATDREFRYTTTTSLSNSMPEIEPGVPMHAITPVLQQIAMSLALLEDNSAFLKAMVQLGVPVDQPIDVDDFEAELSLVLDGEAFLGLKRRLESVTQQEYEALQAARSRSEHLCKSTACLLQLIGRRLALRSNHTPILVAAAMHSAATGNMAFLKWLLDDALPERIWRAPPTQITHSLILIALMSSNVEVVKYLHEEKKMSVSEDVVVSDGTVVRPIAFAVQNGKLEMVQYLSVDCGQSLRTGYPSGVDTIVKYDQVHILEWFWKRSENVEYLLARAVSAAAHGSLQVLQFLYNKGASLYSDDHTAPPKAAVQAAIFNKRLNVLRWLVEQNLCNFYSYNYDHSELYSSWVHLCTREAFFQGLELAFKLKHSSVCGTVDPNLWIIAASVASTEMVEYSNIPAFLLPDNPTKAQATSEDPVTKDALSLPSNDAQGTRAGAENAGVLMMRWFVKLGSRDFGFKTKSDFIAAYVAMESSNSYTLEYLSTLGVLLAPRDALRLLPRTNILDPGIVRYFFTHGYAQSSPMNRAACFIVVRLVDKQSLDLVKWLVEDVGCSLACYARSGTWTTSLELMRYLYAHGIAPNTKQASRMALKMLSNPSSMPRAKWLFAHGASLAYYSSCQPAIPEARIAAFVENGE